MGGMISELMDLPYVRHCDQIEMARNLTATIHRDNTRLELRVVEVTAPFVLVAAKGMAEARIPKYEKDYGFARTKPLKVK